MSANYVQVPPNSTGVKLQTFENTISGNAVDAEAVVIVDTTGTAIPTSNTTVGGAVPSDTTTIGGSDYGGSPVSHPLKIDSNGAIAIGSSVSLTVTQPTAANLNATVSGNVNQTLGSPGYAAITDGTHGPAAVKAASTAAVATDPALVVAISPNNSLAVAISGTLTDRSGTVTTGGTSQQIAAANSSRKFLLIENPSNATEVLYVNFTTAASTTAKNSIELNAGGSIQLNAGTYITTEAVNVTAVTTSHAFIAKEG